LKFLIEENLPLELGRELGVESIHATELGLRLTDEQIWKKASELGCILVTKDADFFDRLALFGPPPKVIWARIGNMRLRELVEFFVREWPDICRLLESSDLVEIFPNRLEAISF
jgi:predicted nuclease of predicted toxin-antitoxin system